MSYNSYFKVSTVILYLRTFEASTAYDSQVLLPVRTTPLFFIITSDSKEKVKGLLRKGYSLQRLVTSLKLVNTKGDNFPFNCAEAGGKH